MNDIQEKMTVGQEEKPTQNETEEVLGEARENFQLSYDEDRDARDEAEKDLKFAEGDQWPDDAKARRKRERRIMLTINRISNFIDLLSNEHRQNKSSIHVLPADDFASNEVAMINEGLIREIESHSDSQIAYTRSFDSAATCGRGFMRVVTDWENPISFNQVLRIKNIKNIFSVFFDPQAPDFLKKESDFAFICSRIKRVAFKRKWPLADEVPFNLDDSEMKEWSAYNWFDEDTIRIAEYWRRIIEKKTLYLIEVPLPDGRTVYTTTLDLDNIPPGAQVVTHDADRNNAVSRVTEIPKIMWYKITAREILESQEWPGRYIPIVPVWGKEVVIGDKSYTRGIVRNSKDAQCLYNYFRTATAESAALAPKAPYIAGKSQVEGIPSWKRPHEVIDVLVYNDDRPGARPPRREPPVQMQPGLTHETLQASDDLKATANMYDANIGITSNEVSGKAINARKSQGLLANYTYSDNFDRALEFLGEIIIDLAPKVYDTDRWLHVVNREGEREKIRINYYPETESVIDTEEEIQMINDLSRGLYKVEVVPGPAYSTQQQEELTTLVELVRNVPVIAPYLLDLIVKNTKLKGREILYRRLKLLLPAEMQEAEDRVAGQDNPEGQQPAPQEPSPEEIMAQLRLAEQELVNKSKNLENMKIKAEAQLIISKIRQIEHEIRTGGKKAAA